MDTSCKNISICEGTWYDKHRDLFFTEEYPPKILKRPLSLSFRVGWYCNLDCKVCLSDSGPHRVFKPFSFTHLLEALSELKPVRIVWTGGEPLLYSIEDDLKQSITLGNFNVVATNVTTTNLPREVGQEVFWDVSLYGWDEKSYLSFTGRDVFRRVERNLYALFDADYSVGVSIRVDVEWARYLPRMIEYISQFPVRKLLLLNTLLIGRLLPGMRSISRNMYKQLEAFIKSSNLPFPTVLPYVPLPSSAPDEGYILIEKGEGLNDIFLVNEVPCSGMSELLQEILRSGPANFRLFTLQQYCMPNDLGHYETKCL